MKKLLIGLAALILLNNCKKQEALQEQSLENSTTSQTEVELPPMQKTSVYDTVTDRYYAFSAPIPPLNLRLLNIDMHVGFVAPPWGLPGMVSAVVATVPQSPAAFYANLNGVLSSTMSFTTRMANFGAAQTSQLATTTFPPPTTIEFSDMQIKLLNHLGLYANYSDLETFWIPIYDIFVEVNPSTGEPYINSMAPHEVSALYTIVHKIIPEAYVYWFDPSNATSTTLGIFTAERHVWNSTAAAMFATFSSSTNTLSSSDTRKLMTGLAILGGTHNT